MTGRKPANKYYAANNAAYHTGVARKDMDKIIVGGKEMTFWQPMETAPKDGTAILVWHEPDSDPYYLAGGQTLTVFGAHSEGLGNRFRTGPCVAVWGGEYTDDLSGEGWGPFVTIPDWWFLDDDNFETPLAPTKWAELPRGATILRSHKGRKKVFYRHLRREALRQRGRVRD